MLNGEIDDAVFEWLGEGLSPSPPAYLKLLGPGRGEQAERVLANLKAVSTRLRDRPEYWRELIRARNWRYTLVGYSALMLVRETRFLDDLLYRFRQGSWVCPQLAVALGLVHPTAAVAELEEVIRHRDSSTDDKRTFSAFAVLKLMGSEAAQEFETSELFHRSLTESPGISKAAYDWLVSDGVVQSHWVFWTRHHSS
jgi:hypothetical protein